MDKNERSEAKEIIMRLDREQVKDVITYLRSLIAQVQVPDDQK